MRTLTMKLACTAFVLLVQTLRCLALDDSIFQLTNKATGFCLVKYHDWCQSIRWTTGDRLLAAWPPKCLGVQGKSVGSVISLYDCDENSELQKWECKNETVLALKGQELYIDLTADNTAVLSRTIGPNNHLTITGTPSGACSRTAREHYTIGGNAYGRTCMFPFHYKDHWYSSCTDTDSSNGRLWCGVETAYTGELWGYCPTTSKEHWTKHITTGAYYQLNTQSALTWSQAETSCKQQGASLLSITDPHQQAYVTALLGARGQGQADKLWTGLVLDPEHGWQWSNGKPYRYLNWDSGHPVADPGNNCGILNGAVQYSWQSSKCNKRLGYICYSERPVTPPTGAPEAEFCSSPWIPYNGHCFFLNRTEKTWTDAQRACRKEGGDLVSLRNVEDQSFVISQLGYASTDQLWIGLNDRRTEGLFDWSDHSTVSFTSWEYGKPAVSTDQEDCVLIKGENGNWADRTCGERHGYICMKAGASEPSRDEVVQNIGCKTGWKRHGSYCYFVGTATKTFDEANAACKSSDSYLADVSNGVDNAFLVSLVGMRPEKHFWLGLSNQKNIEHFVWTNKDTVKYTHWNAEMPGHHQGCVAMTTGIFAGLWDVLPCTNTSKYICKHLAEGASPTPALQTVPPPQCADGWKRVASRNFCYKLHSKSSSQRKSWYEARDYCRAIGGDLLSIHSAVDIQEDRRYSDAWIGLSAPDTNNGYVWSDGSPVNYQHWDDNEPNNHNNAESCAELRLYKLGRGGSWNDAQCEKPNGWLCQIRAGVTPKPPPPPANPDYNMTSDGWLEWKGSQYYINDMTMAMEDARHFCKQRHGDLVTINSEEERVFLWKQISKKYGSFWIGLTVDLDGTFEWMDGSQVVFQRWNTDQPKFQSYDENCASMSIYHGFWHNYNCGNEFRSLCKRDASPPVNATVAPTVPPKGGCRPPWIKFNSKCYSIITNQKLTWEEGRKQCRAMQAKLVSIPSRDVGAFLITQMAEGAASDLWIGFSRSEGSQFFWTDGKPKKYINLSFKRPDTSYVMYLHDRIRGRYRDGHFHSALERQAIREFYQSMRNPPEQNCVVINTNPLLGIGKWIPKSCNDTNGYICHQNVDPSLPDSAEPTISSDYVRIFNDTIKVVTQPMTWDAAKTHCEDDDAKLASIRNEWTQAYVELLALNLKAPLWIGLNRNKTKGLFRFIDGWFMSFTRWAYNEPSRERFCVYVDVDGKWKTAHCNQTMNSVCMKSTDVPPTESSEHPGVCPEDPDLLHTGRNYFWQPFKGYCYIFFTESKRWSDAAHNCVTHGGWLTSIEDPSEQEFIENNMKIFQDSQTFFWTGLYKNHKGEWLWLDGTVMDYTNWGEGQPTDHSYGGIATSDGKWKASYQRYNRPYICKTPKVMPPTPSQSTVVFNPQHPGHVTGVVVAVIIGLAIIGAVVFFLFKKNGHRLPIPGKLTTFDNPLFFSNGQSQADTVDKTQLVENAEEENPEPIITI
ncbi:macrophage mannose receptor 1-like [Sparus aurata]|uniref:macrophage mannose receptor 1-like n=1 Tax=Sparus aurata TaxID=8175 RepID=UPI0011C13638|nr:macrophage mannose receptor 1-like [Sparus aurata]